MNREERETNHMKNQKAVGDFCRMQEILEEMKGLFEEAKDIVRCSSLTQFEKNRAKAYWMNNLEQFLHSDNDPYVCTMGETVEAMRVEESEKDEEEEEEEDWEE